MEREAWIADASIAVKLFRPLAYEPDRKLAETLITRSAIRTTTLCVHEVGNVLIGKTRDSPEQIDQKLRALVRFCGQPIDLDPSDYKRVVQLVREHDLTFYDASYVAIAERLGRRVVSADRDLLDPGLAVDLATATGVS